MGQFEVCLELSSKRSCSESNCVCTFILAVQCNGAVQLATMHTAYIDHACRNRNIIIVLGAQSFAVACSFSR